MAQYILMNKNIPLATVILSDAGYLTDILTIHTPEAFPVGIFTEKKAREAHQ